jgi:hypothetical protein
MERHSRWLALYVLAVRFFTPRSSLVVGRGWCSRERRHVAGSAIYRLHVARWGRAGLACASIEDDDSRVRLSTSPSAAPKPPSPQAPNLCSCPCCCTCLVLFRDCPSVCSWRETRRNGLCHTSPVLRIAALLEPVPSPARTLDDVTPSWIPRESSLARYPHHMPGLATRR